MASWTDALSSVRVLASELFSFVRVVGALPWRSTAADTLGEPDGHPVPVVLVHGNPSWGFLYRNFIGPLTNPARAPFDSASALRGPARDSSRR